MDNYDLDIKGEQILFQTKDAVCKIKVKRELENVQIVYTLGGFDNKEIAFLEGEKLYFNVKKSFIKLGIPINISGGLRVLDTTQKSFMTGGLTEEGIEIMKLQFPELTNKTVENDILGLSIYHFNEDISEVKFVGQEIQILKKIPPPIIDMVDYKEDDKLKTAYSLINSSNVVNDLRVSFILKISAIESLVPEEQRKDEEYCNIISQLNKMIKKDNIKSKLPDAELEKYINRIKSDIGALKKKSIGEKCRNLIVKCGIEKQYLGKDVLIFFKECYSMRSDFVHTGSFKNKEDEINKIRELETYLKELNNLILDILDYYETNIPV
ncbi:hypothetical protein NST38_31345 [Paenibacillus sp. FSL H8-0104]|uniref:hypothetical protein n=1 Tax=Paenibacillus sp. FSL H8-0104 TaxID=2954509 RepID=UPI0030FDBC79